MPKKISRRSLVKTGLTAGVVAPFLTTPLLSSCSPQASEGEAREAGASSPLHILILGGTSFLGPHQIAYALGRGHSITTFTRGRTVPTVHQDLFERVTSLVGDRESDLSALETGTWDVVIDNSGRRAEWTRKTAELLKDRVGMYLYVSSTGVYYPYLGSNITEEAEVLTEVPAGATEEEQLEYNYGVMKTLSEREAQKAFGADRTIVVRPTYMIGPADRTNRFIHWPLRLARGGEVLVPGRTEDRVQYLDVRDTAAFMIYLAEQKAAGTYNAAGPPTPQTMMEFVKSIQHTFEQSTTLVQVDDYEFLFENGIHYLVPWIPAEGKNYGSARISNSKAMAAGLTFRDPVTTVKETHAWWHSAGMGEGTRQAYLADPDTPINREAAILEKWKELTIDN